jgi:hypothetical protein
VNSKEETFKTFVWISSKNSASGVSRKRIKILWGYMQCCESGSTCLLGLPDQDPDPLVRGMDPDPDASIIMQK